MLDDRSEFRGSVYDEINIVVNDLAGIIGLFSKKILKFNIMTFAQKLQESVNFSKLDSVLEINHLTLFVLLIFLYPLLRNTQLILQL